MVTRVIVKVIAFTPNLRNMVAFLLLLVAIDNKDAPQNLDSDNRNIALLVAKPVLGNSCDQNAPADLPRIVSPPGTPTFRLSNP